MKKRNAFLTLLITMVISPIVVGVSSLKSKPAEVSAATSVTKRIWGKIVKPDMWDADGTISHIHYWGGSSSTNWPGVAAKWDYANQKIYYDVPGDTQNVIFLRFKDGSSRGQTSDLTAAGHFDTWFININDDGGWTFDNNWDEFTPTTTTIVQGLADSISTKAKACSSAVVTTAVSTYNGLSTFEQNQFNALDVGEGFTGAQRLAYLRAFYNITTPLSVIETTKKDDNSLMATVIIGVIGLSTLAGYYFLQRKKSINV